MVIGMFDVCFIIKYSLFWVDKSKGRCRGSCAVVSSLSRERERESFWIWIWIWIWRGSDWLVWFDDFEFVWLRGGCCIIHYIYWGLWWEGGRIGLVIWVYGIPLDSEIMREKLPNGLVGEKGGVSVGRQAVGKIVWYDGWFL